MSFSISPASVPPQQQQPQQQHAVVVPWKAAQVYVDLQKASQILSERGWKLAAKWAAEHWIGLPHVDPSDFLTVKSTITDDLFLFPSSSSSSEAKNSSNNIVSPILIYAKTLLDLGEYAHAPAILSQAPGWPTKQPSVEQMPPPLPDLSPAAISVRAYALYMAGERIKEEEYADLKSEPQNQNASRNPYIPQLAEELLQDYHDDRLDAFGLHVYGMVLMAAATGTIRTTTTATTGSSTFVMSRNNLSSFSAGFAVPPSSPLPHRVLIQSLLQFPYNWSAWLDLADCCCCTNNTASSSDRLVVERDIEEHLQSVLGDHFLYHLFCAHLQSLHQDHASALQIYQKWMDSPDLLGGSPQVMTCVAKEHYHLRQYQQAAQVFQDLHSAMPYRLDAMDIYSNILYVQEDAVSLSQLAHTAMNVDKYTPETCCIIGNYYSLKQRRAQAVLSFQRALRLNRNYVSAWTLMGHEYVEWKQTANAIAAYRWAVQVAPDDFRAWYGLGQTYELLGMHLYALYYYKQATTLRPYDARMWCALGQILTQLQRSDQAIRAYERALQQDDTEGVATQRLAALYKEEGQTEKAAQCYYRHLELRHFVTNPIPPPASSSGPTSVPLDVLLQNLVVEDAEAEALLFLANYHRNHSQWDTAALLCSRLLEYPGPEKEQAKALLRELRSRKAHANRRVYNTRSRGPVEFSP